jgi:hypothetical protein
MARSPSSLQSSAEFTGFAVTVADKQARDCQAGIKSHSKLLLAADSEVRIGPGRNPKVTPAIT